MKNRRWCPPPAACARLLAAWFAITILGGLSYAQDYRLGPGDVLTVIVLRHPDMSVPEVLVSAAGKIQLPVAGELNVSGKTLNQVTLVVTQLLRVQLLRPQVTVLLKQARPTEVFVLGAVGKPGVYEVKPGWRVSEMLALAGGLSVRPEVAELTLHPATGAAIALDLPRILSNTNDPSNRVLQPGDTLRISERKTTIKILGQVAKPGAYDLTIGEGVVEALALAGGATPKAALSKVTVKRGGSVIPLDLYKALVLGEPGSNLPLRAGDLIVVPEARARVAVRGAVQKPGYYDIEDGSTLTLTEAVEMAGGPAPRAALSKAVLQHASGTTVPIDLFKLLVHGEQAGNFRLAPGDVVTVPESRGITVQGAVAKPGTFNIDAGERPVIFTVLAMAGGLTVKPEAARITIVRPQPDGQLRAVHIDPVALLTAQDAKQNQPVEDGDVITVSPIESKTQTVLVGGEVRTPGAYELKEGEGLLELITRAGGPTPLAALSRVSVQEPDGTTQIANAYSAIQEGGQKPDLALREGDFVFVPRNTAQVYVTAAVNHPGYYGVPENGTLTIGEALNLAGGLKDRAKAQEIAVIRQTPSGIQRRVISLDKDYNGQLAMNVTLQPGDVLYVPEGQNSRSAWDTITSGLGLLGIFSAFRRR